MTSNNAPLSPDDPREVAGYRLVAKIGEGGMGAVYLSHTRGNQPVALKVIRREYARDEEFRRRFRQEVTAARRVRGYHVVPVVDHDTTGEQPWLATTFVPGLSLDEALTAYGPLPLPAALQLTGCVAEALRAVHAAGVVHRDLKPSNILLGADGPWVIDFGIARANDATRLTRSGGVIGTPQYMSPEQVNGGELGELTAATDVFSLGLVAAVAATGRHPYGDGGALTLATRIAATPHQRPDLTGYPDALRPLLERCLAADPAARPAPDELAEWCVRASGRPARDFTGWLPEATAAEIARRTEAATSLPPATPAPEAPPTPPVAPHAAPTHAAYTPTHVPGQAPNHAPPGGTAPANGAFASQAPPAPPATAPAPAPAPRNRTPLIVAAAVLGAVVVAGAVWALTGGDAPDHGDRSAAGAPAHASPSTSAPGSGPASGSASASAPASPSADTPPPATTGAYTPLFEKKPLTLRAPAATAYSHVDLDLPKTATESGSSAPAGTELTYHEFGAYSSVSFLTTTGVSDGTTPEQCAAAVAANALPGTITGKKDLLELLPEGTVLCTVTTDGNLAMLRITQAVMRAGTLPDYTTELTVWKRS
ncbi:protein kinase domain-containing protein [Streptomyces liangshanensis]|uniref:protein kinase domain-containing protein n=1 Tax=Streptomyces liangshanensis TaxID=2717324 RepID=UPI001FB88FBB|nr:serine/threonine-protein kinase [Streptomyces liangshanensis]